MLSCATSTGGDGLLPLQRRHGTSSSPASSDLQKLSAAVDQPVFERLVPGVFGQGGGWRGGDRGVGGGPSQPALNQKTKRSICLFRRMRTGVTACSERIQAEFRGKLKAFWWEESWIRRLVEGFKLASLGEGGAVSVTIHSQNHASICERC